MTYTYNKVETTVRKALNVRLSYFCGKKESSMFNKSLNSLMSKTVSYRPLRQYKAEIKTWHLQVSHQALLFQENTVAESRTAQLVSLDLSLGSTAQTISLWLHLFEAISSL